MTNMMDVVLHIATACAGCSLALALYTAMRRLSRPKFRKPAGFDELLDQHIPSSDGPARRRSA